MKQQFEIGDEVRIVDENSPFFNKIGVVGLTVPGTTYAAVTFSAQGWPWEFAFAELAPARHPLESIVFPDSAFNADLRTITDTIRQQLITYARMKEGNIQSIEALPDGHYLVMTQASAASNTIASLLMRGSLLRVAESTYTVRPCVIVKFKSEGVIIPTV